MALFQRGERVARRNDERCLLLRPGKTAKPDFSFFGDPASFCRVVRLLLQDKYESH
jgi:hypothetical protein